MPQVRPVQITPEGGSSTGKRLYGLDLRIIVAKTRVAFRGRPQILPASEPSLFGRTFASATPVVQDRASREFYRFLMGCASRTKRIRIFAIPGAPYLAKL